MREPPTFFFSFLDSKKMFARLAIEVARVTDVWDTDNQRVRETIRLEEKNSRVRCNAPTVRLRTARMHNHSHPTSH